MISILIKVRVKNLQCVLPTTCVRSIVHFIFISIDQKNWKVRVLVTVMFFLIVSFLLVCSRGEEINRSIPTNVYYEEQYNGELDPLGILLFYTNCKTVWEKSIGQKWKTFLGISASSTSFLWTMVCWGHLFDLVSRQIRFTPKNIVPTSWTRFLNEGRGGAINVCRCLSDIRQYYCYQVCVLQ